jgi:hypothetical protein
VQEGLQRAAETDFPTRQRSRDDLYCLVEDLEELAQVFLGDSCQQPVWAAEVKVGRAVGDASLGRN